jgi:hypothetical protein
VTLHRLYSPQALRRRNLQRETCFHNLNGYRPKKIKKGIEELGQEKCLQAEWQWLTEEQRLRPGLQQLRPEDLPPGVRASRGYDHRGHCVIFEHKTLGELGKIVLSNMHDGHMLIQAELYKGQENEESSLIPDIEQVQNEKKSFTFR